MEFLGTHTVTKKQLYWMAVSNLDQWPRALQLNSPHYGLFLSFDAQGIPDDVLYTAAARAIGQGAVCCSAWGPDCWRVEHAFDRAAMGSREFEGIDRVLLTTSHEDDRLEEALWFFVYALSPAQAYSETCQSWVAAAVASPPHAHRIRKWLKRRRRTPP